MALGVKKNTIMPYCKTEFMLLPMPAQSPFLVKSQFPCYAVLAKLNSGDKEVQSVPRPVF